MTPRERVARVLSGRVPDRVPLFDGYWTTTIERWRREGLPQGSSPEAYFGTDEIVRIGGDYTMQFPERVIEETPAMRLTWDSDGALRRDLHVAEGWTSQWLDFTIKTPDDWLVHRHRMRYHPSRLGGWVAEAYGRARRAGRFICYSAHACFHPTWMRIGMEQMLMLMLDEPGFVDQLYADHVQLVIDIYEAMLDQGMVFDGAFLSDDLGYQAAPLISPRLYRELVFPHHKRLCDRFAQDGLKTLLHSDGNLVPLVPHFIDAGFAGLHPLEAKAGMDIRDLRARYGDELVLIGNVDVRRLAGTRAEIEAEIRSTLEAGMAGARYIYHSDHSVPSDVSFENYAYAIELVRKYGVYP